MVVWTLVVSGVLLLVPCLKDLRFRECHISMRRHCYLRRHSPGLGRPLGCGKGERGEL